MNPPPSSQQDAPMKTLPTTRAAHLAQPETTETAWLIEGLWSTEAVGIIGGEPKSQQRFRFGLRPAV